MSVDTTIVNCDIVSTDGVYADGSGIAIENGKIEAIGSVDSLPDTKEVIDLEGNMVVPGLIDSHVHVREPGGEHREDYFTASKAASAGGVTTILAMPNTDPAVDTPDHLREVFQLGSEKSIVDFAVYGYVSPDNIDQIQPLANEGVVGFKAYLAASVTGLPILTDGVLLEAMKEVKETGKRFAFHAENHEMIRHITNKFQEQGKTDPVFHNWSRPVIAEKEAVSRLILFSQHTDCPTHIVHLGAGSNAQLVDEAKANGVDITAETMPHYLWFDEEDMKAKGNTLRVNPPVRSPEERQKLWEFVSNRDTFDMISTDHGPYTEEEKGMDDPFQNTWDVNSGFVGLESEVPAMLTFVNEGKLPLEKWIFLHSTRPAKLWDLYPKKGSLLPGSDADLTVIDIGNSWTLRRENLHSKSKVTPFDNETFHGSVEKTFIRGNLVYDSGNVTGDRGFGKPIKCTI